jgi:hypothetical protein
MSLRFSRTGLRRARREWRLLAFLRASGPDDATDTQVHSAEPGKPGLERLWREAGRSGSAPKDGRVLVVGSEDAPDGAVWFDPDAREPSEFGPAGLLRALLVDPGPGPGDDGDQAVTSLLVAAMKALRENGSTVAAITVADHEETLLAACRIAGFQHDRTDCEYVLG